MFVHKETMLNDTIISLSSNRRISDVAGKHGGVISVVVSIVGISFQNLSYVFVDKIVEWGATL